MKFVRGSRISFYLSVLTYMRGHSAGLRADVGAGECKWFSAHLTEVSHEGMIRDTDAHELESTTDIASVFKLERNLSK